MSPEDYVERFKDYVGGRWFKMPYGFVDSFSGTEAITLAVLINIIGADIDDGQHDKFWVRVTTKRIHSRLPSYSPMKIQRTLHSLRVKRIIQVKRQGDPAKRYIFIDVGVLDTWVKDHSVLSKLINPSMIKSDHTLVSSKLIKLYHSDELESKVYSKILVPAARDVKLVKREITSGTNGTLWKALAQELREAVAKVHLVSKKSTPHKWAIDIKKLHTDDGFPIEKIRQVLKWYCRGVTHRDKYSFVVECGKSFREKFVRMEAAMRRNGGVEEVECHAGSEEEIRRKHLKHVEPTPEDLRKFNRDNW